MLLSDTQINELAQPFANMLNSLQNFYDNPQNKEKYKEWYVKKYGREPEDM